MTIIADRFTVILDANVLYPFRMRDILLHFYSAGLYRARWTEQIIAEWRDNLLEAKPEYKQSIDAQIGQMHTLFDEAWVTGYEPLVDGLTLPDPGDRHVLAAAINCGAHHIVTNNLKDFPAEALETFDLEAISADRFLMQTFELYPERAMAVLNRVRTNYTNPPFTRIEFVEDLIAKEMPLLAGRAREHLLRSSAKDENEHLH